MWDISLNPQRNKMCLAVENPYENFVSSVTERRLYLLSFATDDDDNHAYPNIFRNKLNLALLLTCFFTVTVTATTTWLSYCAEGRTQQLNVELTATTTTTKACWSAKQILFYECHKRFIFGTLIVCKGFAVGWMDANVLGKYGEEMLWRASTKMKLWNAMFGFRSNLESYF